MPRKDLIVDEENRNVEYQRRRMGEYVQVNLLLQPRQQHIDLAFDIYELLSFADIDGKMDQLEGRVMEELEVDSVAMEVTELVCWYSRNGSREELIVDEEE